MERTEEEKKEETKTEEKKEETKKEEEKKEDKKEEDKMKDLNARKILSSSYYENLRNVFFYFVNNSGKRLKDPLKQEDIEMSVEFQQDGNRNFKLYNRGQKDDYQRNTTEDIKKLVDDFSRMKFSFSEEKFNYSAKDIRLEACPTKGNFMSFDEIFTIDDEGNKVSYPNPVIQKHILIFCTYITKIKENTINYLKEVNLSKYSSKYDKVLFLFLVPTKMQDKLKEVKKQSEDIISKLNSFANYGENFQKVYSIYPKGYSKYITEDEVRLVRGNYTKYFVIDKKYKINDLKEIDSKTHQSLDNVKIIKNDPENVDFHNFFKLTKKLETADYIYKFKFTLNFNLKGIPNTEDLTIANMNGLKITGKLREKDYLFLKDKVFGGQSDDFDVEKIETVDIELPEKPTCDACKKDIPNEEGIYYCYWCKICFCQKCTEDKMFNETDLKAKYIHSKHNVVYFTTRDKNKLSNLDKKKMGENIYCDRPSNELRFRHSAICNGW
ncbi:MAG: hypothetical protein MJ252_26665 [archaeon]|nr:hypothetical protein [archaeon]